MKKKESKLQSIPPVQNFFPSPTVNLLPPGPIPLLCLKHSKQFVPSPLAEKQVFPAVLINLHCIKTPPSASVLGSAPSLLEWIKCVEMLDSAETKTLDNSYSMWYFYAFLVNEAVWKTQVYRHLNPHQVWWEKATLRLLVGKALCGRGAAWL